MKTNIVNLKPLTPNTPLDKYVFINPEWAIKNDIKNITLVDLDQDRSRYFPLPWSSAVLIQCINGHRTYGELIDIFRYLFNTSEKTEAKSNIDDIREFLNSNSIILAVNDTPKEIPHYQTGDFFIPVSDYSCDQRRSNSPINIVITPTNRCSTDCIYCYADRRPLKASDELSLSRWLELIDEIASLDIHRVDIAGGDSLSRPDSLEIYRHLLKHKILFFISTKTRVTKRICSELIDAGFTDSVGPFTRGFQLSIDSHDPNTTSFLVKKNKFLSNMTESVNNLVGAGIVPIIKCVLTAYNHDHIEPLVNLFSDLGVKEFHFVQYGRSQFRHTDDLFLSSHQKQEATLIYEELSNKRKDLEITFQYDSGQYNHGDIRLSIEDWSERSSCTGGFSAISILPDGNITLCEQIPQKEEYFMGNVRNQSIMDVWTSETIENFLFADRSKFEGSVCHSCEEFELCHYVKGYCYKDALAHYNTLYEAPPTCPKQTKRAKRLL